MALAVMIETPAAVASSVDSCRARLPHHLYNGFYAVVSWSLIALWGRTEFEHCWPAAIISGPMLAPNAFHFASVSGALTLRGFMAL